MKNVYLVITSSFQLQPVSNEVINKRSNWDWSAYCVLSVTLGNHNRVKAKNS